MKKILSTTLLAALAVCVAVSGARAKDPMDQRRTLYASVGQYKITFEAPRDMCFLDQSDYLEGQLLRRYQDMALLSGGGKLIGTFANCMEIAKFQADFQDKMSEPDATPATADPGPITLQSQGSIFWANPQNGKEQIAMTRPDYLDLRSKSFRDEMVHNVSAGDVTSMSFMVSPDQYHFDDKVHRTDDGISLAYTLNAEVEYQKLFTAGIKGTTLIHKMPIEVSMTFSSKTPDKQMDELYGLMDTFMAQQVKLNATN